jgi:hypothetical protein
MDGISDGSLFRENVRYTLGNTAVNRSIRTSIRNKQTHSNFVLFHNGVTILCTDVDTSVQGQLTVKNYSVVNGAQSLTSFYDEKARLTDDLRGLVKVVALRDDALARTITENSNNQNCDQATRFAIKPRDHAPPAEGNVDQFKRLLFRDQAGRTSTSRQQGHTERRLRPGSLGLRCAGAMVGPPDLQGV